MCLAVLEQFADLVQVKWPTVTHGGVTNFSIEHAVGEYNRSLTGRDSSGAFNLANQWDIREGASRQSDSRDFSTMISGLRLKVDGCTLILGVRSLLLKVQQALY